LAEQKAQHSAALIMGRVLQHRHCWATLALKCQRTVAH